MLLASTGISTVGDGAFVAAAPLLALTYTEDPVAIGLVSAAFMAPWLLAALPAGALVDRWPRRTVMLWADLGRAAVLLSLCGFVLAGQATFSTLLVVIFLVGVGLCFFDFATQGMIPVVVGRDGQDLSRFNGRFWALTSTGKSLIGPPVGSLLFRVTSVAPFVFDAISFLLSAALVWRLPRQKTTGPSANVPVVSPIAKAAVFLVRHRDLRMLALNLAFYNLGWSIAFSTFVLFVTDVLMLDSIFFGVFLSAAAGGGIVAGWAAPSATKALSFRQLATFAIILNGVAWLSVGVLRHPLTTVVGLVFVGAASNLASVAMAACRQAYSPDELAGRIAAIFGLVGVGPAALGALAGGAIGQTFGLVAPYVVAFLVLGLGAAVTWPRRRPKNRLR